MPRLTFVNRDGSRTVVEAAAGKSVMEIAVAHGVELEAACEGCLACATCHVHVAEDWFNRLPPPSEEERDMLDLAFAPTPLSRLSCQIQVTEDMDGILFTLAEEA